MNRYSYEERDNLKGKVVDTMKKDLEDIRNGADDVRAFRHIDGHINSVEDYSKHPEGCTCGHCGKAHVP